jgi:MFS superfamily sulfate permease-like transporter
MSIAAAALFNLQGLGVKSVGAVPAGLPALAWPDLQFVAQLLPAALGIALMSFTESVAAARSFWQHDDPPIDANRELLAIGLANLAAAGVGGMPAGGGTSQTAIANAAGARSQMAQWVNAGMVLLCLLMLSAVIGLLPDPALGALILVAAIGMIKPAAFSAIAQVRRDELLWALATLAGVILIGTLQGILIAVAISMLTLFYQANHPPVYRGAYSRAQAIFRRAGDNERDETFPGLLLLRTEGRLNFANAANVAAKMQLLIAQTQPPPRVIVIDCSAIPDIEYTALLMLTDAEQNLRSRGIELWLAGVTPDLRQVIERSPLGVALGPQRFFHNLFKALDAWENPGTGHWTKVQ